MQKSSHLQHIHSVFAIITVLISWASVLDLKLASARSSSAVLYNGVRNLAEGVDLVSGVSIPGEVAVPAGQSLHAAVRGEGHQHYLFNGTAWVLQNATAKLYGDDTEGSDPIGTHFFLPQPDAQGGQPTWEITSSTTSLTSAVTGKSLASVTVDSGSITWVLLQATSHAGEAEGILGKVSYIQRLQTRRGLPPSAEGQSLGDIHSTKYSCIYAFYVQSS
ncbi:hypothetical protein KP509_07G079100 [Ceratopteris richardii]|uniref:Uncharacterized protein n=1 Tax=Ceratopteris richardii TaxID=49495 RepID=A0A8T2UJI3_CERRI|nr:hypothetical protein KP509_07G079100 [Ceratopteris richardii]